MFYKGIGMITSDDFILEDSTKGGYNLGSEDYGYLGNFDEMDKALEVFKNWCIEHNFNPSLYFMSDHGNYWPIDSNGNALRSVVSTRTKEYDPEFDEIECHYYELEQGLEDNTEICHLGLEIDCCNHCYMNKALYVR